jgi:glycine betaine/choline ABC-type transport system substrate-binding protein
VSRHLLRTLLAVLTVLALATVVVACGGDDEEPAAGGGETPTETTADGDEPPMPSEEELEANRIAPIDGAEGTSLTIGSKNFTEQFILGEIYSQALEAAGFEVKKDLNLGSEVIANRALTGGDLDAYPEYTGTALTSFFDVELADVPKDPMEAYELARDGYAKDEITALAPTPFENTFRLGMLEERAEEIGATTTSDLKAEAPNLSISGFPECRQRADCLIGVQKTYGFEFGDFVGSEEKYQVLDSGDADVAFVFTTDGDLASGKYRALEDDKSFFPPYNITLGIRNEKLEEIGPEGQEVLENVQKYMVEPVMQELNARVDVDKEKPADAAAAYLENYGFVDG